MRKTRIFDLVGLIGSLLNGLLGLFRSILDLFFPRNQAREDDALAAHVDQQTERLLAAEDEPAPTYDLASTVREYCIGQPVSLAHLPTRQRFHVAMLFGTHVDIEQLSDRDLEAYVRGDHRDKGLPDIWTRETYARCYADYMAPKRSNFAGVEPKTSEPAYGM